MELSLLTANLKESPGIGIGIVIAIGIPNRLSVPDIPNSNSDPDPDHAFQCFELRKPSMCSSEPVSTDSFMCSA